MDKIIFAKRLKQFCKVSYGTQVNFAKALEISPQALQKYTCAERLPLPSLLKKIGDLGCNINWLLSGEGKYFKSDTNSVKTKNVPIIGEIECGVPVYTQLTDSQKYIDLPDVSHLNNPFIVIARGDSMRPYINPGDLLLCADEPERIKDGRAVVVSFKTIPDTYSSNAKLIQTLDDERIMLYSINTKFSPTIHRKSDIYYIYKLLKIIRDVK